MKIIDRRKLEEFALRHADARSSVKAWLAEAEKADWKNSVDLKNNYPKASIISDNDVYFDIRGGYYRLHAHIAYKTGVLTIEWVGTHNEYTRRVNKRN